MAVWRSGEWRAYATGSLLTLARNSRTFAQESQVLAKTITPTAPNTRGGYTCDASLFGFCDGCAAACIFVFCSPIMCAERRGVALKPIGLEDHPDWPKLGPSLLVATCLILAIRTAKWVVRSDSTTSNMDLEQEIDHAAHLWPDECSRCSCPAIHRFSRMQRSPGSRPMGKMSRSELGRSRLFRGFSGLQQ
jgi:hypothetical protein